MTLEAVLGHTARPGLKTKSHEGTLTARSQALCWGEVQGPWEASLGAAGTGDAVHPQKRSSWSSCGPPPARAGAAAGGRGARGRAGWAAGAPGRACVGPPRSSAPRRQGRGARVGRPEERAWRRGPRAQGSAVGFPHNPDSTP